MIGSVNYGTVVVSVVSEWWWVEFVSVGGLRK